MKKTLSVILVLCLILAAAAPAFAAEADSQGLSQAITVVKKAVDIPSGFTLTDYDSYEYVNDKTKGMVWSLYWENQETEETIYASVDWLGNLVYYSREANKSQQQGLAKINRDQAVKTAEAFLQMALPDLAPKLKSVGSQQAATYDGYSFVYELYENDIPAPFVKVSLAVNKYTGLVNYFRGLEEGQTLPAFGTGETGDLIDDAAAKAAFLEKIGVELIYTSHYNYGKKALNVFAAYRVKEQNTVIDAKTGEKIELTDDMVSYLANSKAAGGGTMDAAAAESGFTREEMEAMENVSGLISKEEAASAAKRAFSALSDSGSLERTSLGRDRINSDQYIWRLNWEKASASVDARTGELLTASLYEEETSKGSLIKEEEALKTAESFVKGVAGEKFALCGEPDATLYQWDKSGGEYTVRYDRLVNDIPFISNGMTVKINAVTGDITYYGITWYQNAQFPSLDGAMGAEKAFEAMDMEGEFTLLYLTGDDDEPLLVYDFHETAVKSGFFDPKTGEMLGYDGRPAASQELPVYTDLAGHWSEKTVLTLMENGYYLEGENFKPDSQISQMDFLKYLYTPSRSYYTDEEFLEFLKDQGILKDGETAGTGGIMRQDAAKYAIRFLGLGKAAEVKGIYANLFQDKPAAGYEGYAALCYGLGIMKGDKNGNFDGSRVLTNAEAASVIYNVLQVQ